MTQTLISLISIIIGIIGANLAGLILKKYTLGIIGNTIAGVFGSILFIKSFGRLGFDPNAIMKLGNINLYLFIINIVVSFFGGVIAVILIQKFKKVMS
ncbi:MAG: hypothetical protein GQ540_00405 [Lutibacter sp.]|uniref:hypothetical protein n=1 Tax=Lutibacter sp. TaxID=1925666 RepID=UPI001A1093A4|nr:hypothetical protein [Lutibacter sp.]NOR26970.1 hypothetical protein [Lutibacter sp.]